MGVGIWVGGGGGCGWVGVGGGSSLLFLSVSSLAVTSDVHMRTSITIYVCIYIINGINFVQRCLGTRKHAHVQ